MKKLTILAVSLFLPLAILANDIDAKLLKKIDELSSSGHEAFSVYPEILSAGSTDLALACISKDINFAPDLLVNLDKITDASKKNKIILAIIAAPPEVWGEEGNRLGPGSGNRKIVMVTRCYDVLKTFPDFTTLDRLKLAKPEGRKEIALQFEKLIVNK